jgi:hypothetical protein
MAKFAGAGEYISSVRTFGPARGASNKDELSFVPDKLSRLDGEPSVQKRKGALRLNLVRD